SFLSAGASQLRGRVPRVIFQLLSLCSLPAPSMTISGSLLAGSGSAASRRPSQTSPSAATSRAAASIFRVVMDESLQGWQPTADPCIVVRGGPHFKRKARRPRGQGCCAAGDLLSYAVSMDESPTGDDRVFPENAT